MARKKYLSNLHDNIETTLHGYIGKGHMYALKMRDNWHDIIPHSIAEHCIPAKLTFPTRHNNSYSHGTLTIICSLGYQTIIAHQKETILYYLQSYYGNNYITKIIIKTD